jgi:hypothetical protein
MSSMSEPMGHETGHAPIGYAQPSPGRIPYHLMGRVCPLYAVTSRTVYQLTNWTIPGGPQGYAVVIASDVLKDNQGERSPYGHVRDFDVASLAIKILNSHAWRVSLHPRRARSPDAKGPPKPQGA